MDADVYEEILEERERAHAKHGDKSMEGLPIDHPTRITILMEEVGEVAREFNEANLRGDGVNPKLLRSELIQVAAMAAAWADAITERCCACSKYVVDYSDPDLYHPENIETDDSQCPVHGPNQQVKGGSDE